MRAISALVAALFSSCYAALHLPEGYAWTQLSVADNEVVKQAEVLPIAI
jgi:hypothetical protein